MILDTLATKVNLTPTIFGLALWPVVLIILGFVAALIGRKVFWLAVAVAGFALGWFFTVTLLPDVPAQFDFVIALIGGVVGGFIGVKAVPLIAGATGGVLFGLTLGLVSLAIWPDSVLIAWIAFFLGLVLGYLFVTKNLETGLGVVSALAGGALVGQGLSSGFNVASPWPLVAALAVAVLGIVVQVNRSQNKQQAAEDAAAVAGQGQNGQ